MKIRKTNRNGGSVLLCFVVATIAMIVGGVAIYHVYKWARRCDNGEPVNRPGVTNSTEIPTPGNGNGCDITSVWWKDQQVWWEWWDETSASPLESAPQEKAAGIVVYGVFDGTNMALSTSRQVNSNSYVTFSALGMPVDAYGFPADMNWELNKPTGAPEFWTLERSTNMEDWIEVSWWNVWPGLTNGWYEVDPSPSELFFYRARKQ